MYNTLVETNHRLKNALNEMYELLDNEGSQNEYILSQLKKEGAIPIEALLSIYRKVRSEGVLCPSDVWEYKPTPAAIYVLARCTDEIEASANLIQGEYVGIIKNNLTNLHHAIIAASQEDDPCIKYLDAINRFIIRGIRNNLLQMIPSKAVKKTLEAINFYLHNILNIVEEDDLIKIPIYIDNKRTQMVFQIK